MDRHSKTQRSELFYYRRELLETLMYLEAVGGEVPLKSLWS